MMQDHSQAAMRNCHAYASPLFPKACNELPCLAGLLTRLSLSPSHADEPHSGLIMTDLTQTYSSGHCCRFARHSLNQSGCKDTAIFKSTGLLRKKSIKNPQKNLNNTQILNDFETDFLRISMRSISTKRGPTRNLLNCDPGE